MAAGSLTLPSKEALRSLSSDPFIYKYIYAYALSCLSRSPIRLVIELQLVGLPLSKEFPLFIMYVDILIFMGLILDGGRN